MDTGIFVLAEMWWKGLCMPSRLVCTICTYCPDLFVLVRGRRRRYGRGTVSPVHVLDIAAWCTQETIAIPTIKACTVPAFLYSLQIPKRRAMGP